MRKILLASGGLTLRLQNHFLEQIGKEPSNIRILFVPTAAMCSDNAKEYICFSLEHFTDIGILPENIFMYHLGYLLSENYNPHFRQSAETPPFLRLLSLCEMNKYDVLFLLGGDARFLMDEINRTGFNKTAKKAIDSGLFYFGVSAGSMVACGNFADSLGYVKNPIEVHCEQGTPCGVLPKEGEVYLTDTQAIWIDNDIAQIIE